VAWTVDLLDLAGASVATNVPYQSARVSWSLEGAGSADIELRKTDISTSWAAGTRRILIKDGATSRFGGFVEHLSRSGGPDQEKYRAGALGLASVLERRVVHGDFTQTTVGACTIAWQLIAHAQGQTNGSHGFTLGTITGTQTSRTRHFCDGDSILEQIEELAALDPGGFMWEISPAGVFNAWVGDRGSSSGLTLAESDAILFEIEAETSDLLTYVTALGQADEPCGAPLEIRSSGLVATYGRREATVDMESQSVSELDQLADQELKVRGRSRLSVKASWLDAAGYRPWAFGTVWLGDTVSVTLPAWFGGTQTMRVVSIDLSLEIAQGGFVTYEFQAV
jgi:hypothetical protein